MSERSIKLRLTLPEDVRERGAGYRYLEEVAREIGEAWRRDLPLRFPDVVVDVEALDPTDDELDLTLAARRNRRVATELDLEWKPGEEHAELELETFTTVELWFLFGLMGATVLAAAVVFPFLPAILRPTTSVLIIALVIAALTYRLLHRFVRLGSVKANAELLAAAESSTREALRGYAVIDVLDED